MLGRREAREIYDRLDKIEEKVERLTTLEGVVTKLEEFLYKTGDTVSHLNIFMERLEERSTAQDKWTKRTTVILLAFVPILTGFSGYFITKLVDNVENLEDKVNKQNETLVELGTKLRFKINLED